ncbi:hypothetical protein D3C85_952830 [compost metagenome]
MQADLVHAPRAFVRSVVTVGHFGVMTCIVLSQVTWLLSLGFIVTSDQADAVAVIVRRVEPFA